MPAEIVPRWEWRTFGEDFGAAEEALRRRRARRGERRAVPALRGRAMLGEGPRRACWTSRACWPSTTTGSSSGCRSPSARSRSPRDDVGAAARPAARGRAAARPRGLHRSRSSSTRSCGRSTRCCAVDGAQATQPATRSAAAWPRSARSAPTQGSTRTIAVESEDPARVLAVRALARPRHARERVHGPRAEDARRLRDGAASR